MPTGKLNVKGQFQRLRNKAVLLVRTEDTPFFYKVTPSMIRLPNFEGPTYAHLLKLEALFS